MQSVCVWVHMRIFRGSLIFIYSCADEMGLGKTVQVVSFIQCMKHEKLNVNPVLIIAPKSILFQWEKVCEFLFFFF